MSKYPEIDAVLAGDSEGCIVCGDCLEVMAEMPDKCVGAVVTDPPYGLDFKYNSHDDNRDAWFILIDKAVPEMRRLAKFVVMPCCGIDRMGWWYATHAPEWLIAWYKGSPGHRSHVGFNDWEAHLVWGKPPKQMHDYFQTRCGFTVKGHPCPKPIEWGLWLCKRAASDGDIILDPFCGSGTTCVAAKQLGRRFIGIEIDEKYCEIARERLRETQPLFDKPKITQTGLIEG